MKKHINKKHLLLIADALLIPGMVLCERLSDYMLSLPGECSWIRLGGKCVSCGGTHFVNYILNGNIKGAFMQNQFLFVLLILIIAVFILLHLDWLFCLKWAKKLLSRIFSIPTLIILAVFMLGFFFARNIPVFIRIAQILF